MFLSVFKDQRKCLPGSDASLPFNQSTPVANRAIKKQTEIPISLRPLRLNIQVKFMVSPFKQPAFWGLLGLSHYVTKLFSETSPHHRGGILIKGVCPHGEGKKIGVVVLQVPHVVQPLTHQQAISSCNIAR